MTAPMPRPERTNPSHQEAGMPWWAFAAMYGVAAIVVAYLIWSTS